MVGGLIRLFRRWLFKFSGGESMQLEFSERFPGRCFICSFHRHGVSHGFIGSGEVLRAHDCLEGNSSLKEAVDV